MCMCLSCGDHGSSDTMCFDLAKVEQPFSVSVCGADMAAQAASGDPLGRVVLGVAPARPLCWSGFNRVNSLVLLCFWPRFLPPPLAFS